MSRREIAARIIARDAFAYAEHWRQAALRMRCTGWEAFEYTGRYLVTVQDAYAFVDAIAKAWEIDL
jgi:hypothetical protein